MKKLFSVLLVLALCSFASATVNIYITDATGASIILMQPSDTIELLIWYTGTSEFEGGGGIQMFDVEATVTGPGTILGGMIIAVGINTAYDMVCMPGRMGGDIELASGRDDWFALGSGLLQPLATVSFHLDDSGEVVIGLADGATWDTQWNQITPTMHGMTINQIPEPASMTILALGGLAMLGRKRRAVEQ